MKKILFLFLVLLSVNACVKFKTADLVVHNARIYTVNQEFEVAQAMAIKNGRIIAIGKEHEIMNKYRATELLDAETRPIYPGFMDAHCHFLGGGLNSLGVDLSKCTSMAEVVTLLEEHEANNPESKWLIGYGWNENNWKNKEVNNQSLNEKFPTISVLLWRVDGHSLIVNESALIQSGIKIEQFNGLVSEEYIPYFTQAISYTKAQKKAGLRFAQEDFFKKGITTVSDAGLSVEEVKLIHSMHQSGTLDMNVYAMIYGTEQGLKFDSVWNNKLNSNAYKVMLDGSVGSRTALFSSPYKGTNTYGKLLMTKDSLRTIAQKVFDKGAQLNVHCIGDSAVKITLEVMGEVLQGTNGLGWRIEHAQAVKESDLALFKKYAIIPSVQPSHLEDDKNMAEEKLEISQLKNSYRLRSLMEQNLMLPLGSDYPVASNNPIHTFYYAVHRASKPWISSSENLTREEALKGITFWVALGNKTYEKNGSLEVGKMADFVILERDIMKVPKEEIKQTQVLKTYVNGVKKYEKLN